MKRIISLLLLFAILLTMLCACGPNNSNNNNDDSNDSGNLLPGGENSGGENSGGENSGGQNSGGQNSGGETPDQEEIVATEGLIFEYKNADYNGSGTKTEFYTVKGITGTKEIQTIIIPSIHEGLPVLTISSNAFSDFRKLEKVVLPDSLKRIEGSAFYGCTSLKEISLPKSLETIGSYAFWFTALTEITIPTTVESISNHAFMNCSNLKKVNFEANSTLSCIYGHAFENCTSLTSVTLPDSLYEISEYAFKNCTSLASVTLGKSIWNIAQYAFEGCSAINEYVIPENVTCLTFDMFRGTLLEDSIEEEDGLYYFENWLIGKKDKKTSRTIKNGTKTICDNVFQNDSTLTSVILPEGLKVIGTAAFYLCENLNSINFVNSIERIKSGAFHSCEALDNVILPDSVCYVESNAFYSSAFYDNRDNWEELSTDSATYLKGALYSGNVLLKINENLTEFCTKDGTTVIAEGAFDSCANLECVTLSDSVIYVCNEAFLFLDSLKTINIAKSVKTLGDYALNNLASLEEINYSGTKAEWEDIEKNDAKWVTYTPSFTIHASDGDITVDSTISDIYW